LLFNSIFQLFATGVGKVASRIALFVSTMWVYFLVLAGLVMLRSAAALFPPSPLLYPVASFSPIIMYILIHACHWARRQFSRWRRRKPHTRPRRAHTLHPCLRVIRVAFLLLLRCWFALLFSAFLTQQVHTFLFGALHNTNVPSTKSLHHLQSFTPYRNGPLQKADSHMHHPQKLPSSPFPYSEHFCCHPSAAFIKQSVKTTKFNTAPGGNRAHNLMGLAGLHLHDLLMPEHFLLPSNRSCAFASIPIFLFTAHHQQTAPFRLPGVHSPAPTCSDLNPIPSGCTIGQHLSQSACPFILNPVAAALRLPGAAIRSKGIIAALWAWAAAARSLQHNLQSVVCDGATQLAAHFSSAASGAWAATYDSSQRLGQARWSGQVSASACMFMSLHACRWGDRTFVSAVLSEFWSVISPFLLPVWSVSSEFFSNNYFILTIIIIAVSFCEFLSRLMRFEPSCDVALAEANVLIAASPEFRRIALRLELYRYATGRQLRRTCTVRVLRRPLVTKRERSCPTLSQIRYMAYASTLATILIVVGLYFIAKSAHSLLAAHTVVDSTLEPACWRERGVALGEDFFICGTPDSHSQRWDWGGAASLQTPLHSIPLHLGVFWKAIGAVQEFDKSALDQSSGRIIGAVMTPSALMLPISPPCTVFPELNSTHSTASCSPELEFRPYPVYFQSSVSTKTLGRSFHSNCNSNLSSRFLINNSWAAQQSSRLCRLPDAACAAVLPCAGAWLTSATAVLGCAPILPVLCVPLMVALSLSASITQLLQRCGQLLAVVCCFALLYASGWLSQLPALLSLTIFMVTLKVITSLLQAKGSRLRLNWLPEFLKNTDVRVKTETTSKFGVGLLWSRHSSRKSANGVAVNTCLTDNPWCLWQKACIERQLQDAVGHEQIRVVIPSNPDFQSAGSLKNMATRPQTRARAGLTRATVHDPHSQAFECPCHVAYDQARVGHGPLPVDLRSVCATRNGGQGVKGSGWLMTRSLTILFAIIKSCIKMRKAVTNTATTASMQLNSAACTLKQPEQQCDTHVCINKSTYTVTHEQTQPRPWPGSGGGGGSRPIDLGRPVSHPRSSCHKNSFLLLPHKLSSVDFPVAPAFTGDIAISFLASTSLPCISWCNSVGGCAFRCRSDQPTCAAARAVHSAIPANAQWLHW
jgi:hypothetical protein